MGRRRVPSDCMTVDTRSGGQQWHLPVTNRQLPRGPASGACDSACGLKLRCKPRFRIVPVLAAVPVLRGCRSYGAAGARRVGVTMTTISESASPRMPDGEAQWARGLPGTMAWEHTTGSLRHSLLLLPMSSSCA